MFLRYLFIFFPLVLSNHAVKLDDDCPDCMEVDINSPETDCVRIRSLALRKLVFGTGYFTWANANRYMGVWEHYGTPWNSAFKLERIPGFIEPVYYIKMINTQEYLEGGSMLASTHEDRVPVFAYHNRLNTTSSTQGVWVFEKASDPRGAWVGNWYIKSLYYDQYWIASKHKSGPPAPIEDGGFRTLQLDRRNLPLMTDEHQFYIEQCG